MPQSAPRNRTEYADLEKQAEETFPNHEVVLERSDWKRYNRAQFNLVLDGKVVLEDKLVEEVRVFLDGVEQGKQLRIVASQEQRPTQRRRVVRNAEPEAETDQKPTSNGNKRGRRAA